MCEGTYGASDFIALCKNYDAIFLTEMPKITMENRNAVRRLILLVLNY